MRPFCDTEVWKLAKKDAPTSKYEVFRRIRHNGDYYEVGEAVELTDADAETLKEIGAVKPFPVAPQGSQTPPKGSDQTPPGGDNFGDKTPPTA